MLFIGGSIMKKVLCFIFDNMSDFEMILACDLVDAEVTSIAYDKELVQGTSGMMYKPVSTVKDALLLDNIDGLIIPGGANNEQRPELTELIQKLNNDGKLLAAICAGPQYLARASVLANRQYTTTLTREANEIIFSSSSYPFTNGTYVESNVVRDHNIITAKGGAFVDFATEICDYFGQFKNSSEKLQMAQHYKGMQEQ